MDNPTFCTRSLRTSMGIGGSRDDLIAFLNANSSPEWRRKRGDLSAFSMKELISTPLLHGL